MVKAKHVTLAVVLAAALVAAAWVSWVLTGAKITGQTLEERLQSVYRISAERPHGAVKALAGAASGAPEVELRRAAMAGLTQFSSVSARATIEKGLSDPDAEVRSIAAGGLGAHGDKAAADVLIETIEGETDAGVRHAAMAALARCDDPRSVVVLLTKAEAPGDGADRMAAMTALAGKLHSTLKPDRRPENGPLWRDLIQRLKRMTYVQNAFATAGATLVQRPADLIGRDPHPERRTDEWPPPDDHDHDDDHETE